MNKRTLALACAVFLGCPLPAFADSIVGDTVEKTISVSSHVFALPPGQWDVIQATPGQLMTTAGPGAATLSYRLIQIDSATGRRAEIGILASRGTMRLRGWNKEPCKGAAIFKDELDGTYDFPSCLRIDNAPGGVTSTYSRFGPGGEHVVFSLAISSDTPILSGDYLESLKNWSYKMASSTKASLQQDSLQVPPLPEIPAIR
jgi:hypothetical protein